MVRQRGLLGFAAVLVIAGAVLASCKTDDAGRGAASQAQPPLVPRLEVPAVAVRLVEAPGMNLEDLTARLRKAVDESSGAPCVDEAAVRAELAACTEAPCPDLAARQFRNAAYVVDASVSRVGDAMLATVRVQRGVDEVARATASAPDARTALTDAGAKAGAALRAVLLKGGAAPLPMRDPNDPDQAPHVERGE